MKVAKIVYLILGVFLVYCFFSNTNSFISIIILGILISFWIFEIIYLHYKLHRATDPKTIKQLQVRLRNRMGRNHSGYTFIALSALILFILVALGLLK